MSKVWRFEVRDFISTANTQIADTIICCCVIIRGLFLVNKSIITCLTMNIIRNDMITQHARFATIQSTKTSWNKTLHSAINTSNESNTQRELRLLRRPRLTMCETRRSHRLVSIKNKICHKKGKISRFLHDIFSVAPRSIYIVSSPNGLEFKPQFIFFSKRSIWIAMRRCQKLLNRGKECQSSSVCRNHRMNYDRKCRIE